ncbi:MAG: hypothetical protein Q9223_002361 [Gallowayella weberi]
MFSRLSETVGLLLDIVKAATALFCSLDVLSHDIDGVIDLLVTTYCLESGGSVVTSFMMGVGPWSAAARRNIGIVWLIVVGHEDAQIANRELGSMNARVAVMFLV